MVGLPASKANAYPGIASLTPGMERAAKPGGCPEYSLFDGPPQVAVKFFYGRGKFYENFRDEVLRPTLR